MTTQAVTAIVGNSRMSKAFSVTSTDAQWDGNIMVDDIGGNPIGILIPGTTIDKVCVQYAAGGAALPGFLSIAGSESVLRGAITRCNHRVSGLREGVEDHARLRPKYKP